MKAVPYNQEAIIYGAVVMIGKDLEIYSYFFYY